MLLCDMINLTGLLLESDIQFIIQPMLVLSIFYKQVPDHNYFPLKFHAATRFKNNSVHNLRRFGTR